MHRALVRHHIDQCTVATLRMVVETGWRSFLWFLGCQRGHGQHFVQSTLRVEGLAQTTVAITLQCASEKQHRQKQQQQLTEFDIDRDDLRSL